MGQLTPISTNENERFSAEVKRSRIIHFLIRTGNNFYSGKPEAIALRHAISKSSQ
jgi:hypothetical protein